MDSKLLDLLVCPATKGPLVYNRERQELQSRSARLAYPLRDGIPLLLESEARALSDEEVAELPAPCLLYTSPSPRDVEESRMPSSA